MTTPPIQTLLDALEAAAKARSELWLKIEKEVDFQNRYHAINHDRYLLEIKYNWADVDEAWNKAREAIRVHYPELARAAARGWEG